jgi:galactokinase
MNKISTPGRICLFGEHQDYLDLPVIAAAINRRVGITFATRQDKQVFLDLPDIKLVDSFHLDSSSTYRHKRDYFKSAVNVLRKEGYEIDKGLSAVVQGNIPINSGTSSSSALVVTWLATLLTANGIKVSAKKIADMAVDAEVSEFGEAGGIMDQYSTALGELIFLNTSSRNVESLPVIKGTFVLGDSGLPKATQDILLSNKTRILNAVEAAKRVNKRFGLKRGVYQEDWNLTDDEHKVLKATLRNRDITIEAKKMLKDSFDKKHFGDLLNEEHGILNQVYGLSPEKINNMIAAALDAGAYGGKINGSGGGGCMFVYAPDNPDKVVNAIEGQGGKAYKIEIDKGLIYEN